MNPEPGLSCPACGAPHQVGDLFCEECGARLEQDQHEPPGDTRVELDLVIAAAVSDQGRVHRRNEDAFQLEVVAERNVAVVVCDGISSASAGNVAARDAARAAGTVLGQAVGDGTRDANDTLVEAIQAANDAVVDVEWTTRTQRVDPSCTLVSALCRGPELVIAWVGDSRAYWFDAGQSRQLTIDDSFAEEGIAKGLLTPEQAAQSPFLHSITHWVGPDSPQRPPRLVSLRPEHPGRLVLCTDGLWNYAPSADELGRLVAALPDGAAPVAVARALADTANERGGHDNITVAVVDIDPSAV
ncbi:MAG TPA: protein phosphatase 2C domain-containing protein [Solirubrobacteraceae bacterium]|nr:protein phosphatase 2C domain-containing protein [Solirubrobacteraceae bacterium]